MVIARGIDDKSIIGMNISGFIHGMVPRSKTPGWISTVVAMGLRLILGTWRESKVHQMGYGRLSFATRSGPHDGLLE